MATSSLRRFCLLKVSRRLSSASALTQARCPLHTGCRLQKDDQPSGSSAPSQGSAAPSQGSLAPSGSSAPSQGSLAAEDNVMRAGLQAKPVTKAQKISRAMQAYMERAQNYDKMIKKEIDEYDLGRRHLANIMGQDVETMEQEEVDRAIEYLLPSGLFEKKARPVLKHPFEVFPKRKAAQFGTDGRPFHSMFYTGKPNFYSLLLTVSLKLEDLKQREDKLIKKGLLHEVAERKLMLLGSEWMTLQGLKDMMLEPVSEQNHKHFVVLFERLADHPLAFREEEFIMTHRRKLALQSFAADIPKVLTDDSGRAYMTATGLRKTSKAEVTVRAKGDGKFTINGHSILYFPYITHRETVFSPLQLAGRLGEMDVEATVEGGGHTGQAGAIRLALAKALTSFVDTDTREKLRIAGLLTQDVRTRERKKAGQKKARKKFTWKKR